MSKIILALAVLAVGLLVVVGAQAGGSVSAPQKNTRVTAQTTYTPRVIVRNVHNQTYGISEFSSSSAPGWRR
jgi:Flp pilus assembly protein CpaB